MNGGDTDTGGTQVDPRVVPPSSSGSQPVESAAPAAEDASVLTISHDQPSLSSGQQSIPQPGVQASTPVTPGATTSPAVSPPITNVPGGVIPNTTVTTPPASYPTVASSTQPQPANQLIAQTFTTDGQTPTAVRPIFQHPQATQLHGPSPMSQYSIVQPQPAYEPVTPNTNNITSNTPKKNKKLFIIVGIIVLCVCIGLVIVMLFHNQALQMANSPIDARNAFNQYANYFLFGTDETNSKWIDSSIKEPESSFSKQIQSKVYNSDYSDRLKEKFKSFKEVVGDEIDDSASKKNEYLGLVDLNDVLLSFVTKYYSDSRLDQSNILFAYIEGGEDSANTHIRNVVDEYEGVNGLYGSDFSNLLLTLGSERLSLILLYAQQGCLANGEIDYNCATEYSNDVNEEHFRKIAIANNEIDLVVEQSARDLYYLLFEIGKPLNYIENNQEDNNE